MATLGIDIGGTSIKYVLLDKNKKILTKDSRPTDLTSETTFLNSLGSIYRDLSKKYLIESVGIGFPGAVNTTTGEIYSAVNLGFSSLDIVGYFNNELNVTAYILNDANAAAYGEYAFDQKSQDLIFITLGTGLGGGIILNGNLYLGKSFSAGEIGHIPVFKQEKRICGCGNLDCLETYVARKGLLNSAYANEHLMNLFHHQPFDVKDLFDQYHTSSIVKSFLNSSFEILSKALAGLVNTMDVDTIIIGGGFSNAKEVLLDILRPSFEEALFPTLKGKVSLELSTLKNDAGSIGSALYAQIKS